MDDTTKQGLRLAGILAISVLSLTACGSGGAGDTAASTAPAATSAGHAIAAHLTTANGLAVYLFAPDTDGTSHCYGGCASAWPPVAAGSKLEASGGKVDRGLLATITRSDGSKQLTYAGHPLYRYIGDAKAGQTTGQGLDASGGLWCLVTPKGAAITSKTSADST